MICPVDVTEITSGLLVAQFKSSLPVASEGSTLTGNSVVTPISKNDPGIPRIILLIKRMTVMRILPVTPLPSCAVAVIQAEPVLYAFIKALLLLLPTISTTPTFELSHLRALFAASEGETVAVMVAFVPT